jgi:hypothetical protein
LAALADDWGISLREKDFSDRLGEHLEGVSSKSGARRVFLADERDAPVADCYSDFDRALANQNVLYKLYSSLLSNSRYIHFALVVGVSGFAMPPGGFGTNDFTDISLAP